MDWSVHVIFERVSWGRDMSDSVASLKIHDGESDGDGVQVVTLGENLAGCIVARRHHQCLDSGACLANSYGDDDHDLCLSPCLLRGRPTGVDYRRS